MDMFPGFASTDSFKGKKTYSRKFKNLPSAPPSLQKLLQAAEEPDHRIPFDDAAIKQIGARKAGLNASNWQLVVDNTRDEFEHESDSDAQEELAALFGFTQSDRDCDVPDEDRVASNPTAPSLPDLSRDDLVEVKRQWREYYQQGIPTLAKAVMKEEIDARLKGKGGLQAPDLDWTAKTMEEILLSTDRILLESVMFSNLSVDVRNKPTLRAVLAQIEEQAKNQPSIYYQQLVDSNGKSPTPNDLLIAMEKLMGYMKGCDEAETEDIDDSALSDDDCHKIDTVKGFRKHPLDIKRTQNGYRKYMFTKVKVKQAAAPKGKAKAGGQGKGKAKAAPPSSSSSSSDSDSDDSTAKNTKQKKGASGPQIKATYDERYCSAHAIQTMAFVEAFRERIAKLDPQDLNEPLAFPLCEVGYSNRSIDRLKAHKAHSSSNYIMNAIEAIFMAFKDEFSGEFSIAQFIIYLIWKTEQAEIAEIGLTKLAEGYIHNGGGFSHYPAGLSNASAQRTSHREWNDAQLYLANHSVYRKNIEYIQSVAKAETEAYEEEAKQLSKKAAQKWSERTTKAFDIVRGAIEKNQDEKSLYLERRMSAFYTANDKLRKAIPNFANALSETVQNTLQGNKDASPFRWTVNVGNHLKWFKGFKDAEPANEDAMEAVGEDAGEAMDEDVDQDAGIREAGGVSRLTRLSVPEARLEESRAMVSEVRDLLQRL